MRLLVDELYDPAVARQLAGRGYDVVWVGDTELRERPDAEIFAFAQSSSFAILTENVDDFLPLAREWRAMGRVHHTIAYTTNHRFPRGQPSTTGRLIESVATWLDAEPDDEVPSNREIWLR